MSNSSVGGVPTSGLGVAAAVKLTGTGVVQTYTPVANTRGVAQYTVNIPLGGSVVVTSQAIDDAGAVVGVSGGGFDNFLKTAATFAILGASAVTGSTGAGSTVSGGNIGISPNNQTSVTNFPPSTLTPPGVFHYADAVATQAQVDLAAAIVLFQALPPTQSGLSNLSTNNGGGGAGVYRAGNYFSAPASSLDIPTTITLDAQGNPNATFVFVAGSTITLESGASVLLVNGALAKNVYWVNGSSFTSVFAVTSNMVGSILAHTSITLGGGTLAGRALANIGAVTLSTTDNITAPAGASAQTGWNAIVLNSVPQSSNPTWYRPSNAGKYSNAFFAPVSVDDTDSNPWTVRGRVAGQCVVEFQIPTFLNTEGTLLTDVNTVMDETPIDSISAELICTVTGGTS
jgi:hypothetical protein